MCHHFFNHCVWLYSLIHYVIMSCYICLKPVFLHDSPIPVFKVKLYNRWHIVLFAPTSAQSCITPDWTNMSLVRHSLICQTGKSWLLFWCPVCPISLELCQIKLTHRSCSNRLMFIFYQQHLVLILVFEIQDFGEAMSRITTQKQTHKTKGVFSRVVSFGTRCRLICDLGESGLSTKLA